MTAISKPRLPQSSLIIAAPIVFAILQILTPVLPQLGIGEPIGDRSDVVRSLVTPAGWAFSIWGPLYAGSLVFAVYQALPSQRDNGLLASIRMLPPAPFSAMLYGRFTRSPMG